MAPEKGKFGAIIRQAREGKGISLRELAKQAGVSPTFLSKVETEDWKPKEEKLRKIASLLGLDEADLVARAGRIPSELTDIIKRHGARSELETLLRTTKRFSSADLTKVVQHAQKVGKDK